METEIKYLNEKQVSEMTGRALSTLRNERFLGKGMPYIKIGKSVNSNSTRTIINTTERHITEQYVG